jgi:hypothetical protein
MQEKVKKGREALASKALLQGGSDSSELIYQSSKGLAVGEK